MAWSARSTTTTSSSGISSGGLVNERDDPHLVLAVRAQKRVGFPNLLDEFAPLFGIPSIVAKKLEAHIRDVLGDARDEVARAEHLTVALSTAAM